MTSLPELLEHWLPTQRWYGAKGRTIGSIETEAVGSLAGEQVELVTVLAAVRYADGGDEHYQVPLAARAEPWPDLEGAYIGEGDGRHLYDATHDPDAAALLLEALREEARSGPIAYRRIGEIGDGLRARVVGAEQSNTSLVFGEELICKIFRRVAPGRNPDLELTRALQEAGSPHVAPIHGWVETQLDGEEATLAVLQRFARSASEGWALAQGSVRDLYAEADLHADEVGGDFAAEAQRLGVASGEVHALLAQVLPSGLAATGRLAAVAAAMHTRLDRAILDVPELTDHAPALREAFDALAEHREEVPVQRVHGDFHLGQVLRTDAGWLLLDFEGEPARPLAERRALASPLRDVAGMLRSFDYAARSLLPDYPLQPGLEYRATEWAERNGTAFCEGYAAATGRDPRADGVLLQAFELDKAVYEVVYEARHRPTWLPIPLGSIARLTR